MNRAKALQIFVEAKPELAQRYGVVRLALFGAGLPSWTLRPNLSVCLGPETGTVAGRCDELTAIRS